VLDRDKARAVLGGAQLDEDAETPALVGA
jgi:hypothetical protein